MNNLPVIFFNTFLTIFSLFWFYIKGQDFVFYITHPLKTKKETFERILGITLITIFILFFVYGFVTQGVYGSIDFWVLGMLFFIATLLNATYHQLDHKGFTKIGTLFQLSSLIPVVSMIVLIAMKLIPLWEPELLTKVREHQFPEVQTVSQQEMIKNDSSIREFKKLPDKLYVNKTDKKHSGFLGVVKNHLSNRDGYILPVGVISIANNRKTVIKHELVHYNINKLDTIQQTKVLFLDHQISRKVQSYLDNNECSKHQGFCSDLEYYNNIITQHYGNYLNRLEEHVAYGYEFVNNYDKNNLEDQQLKEIYDLYQKAFEKITK